MRCFGLGAIVVSLLLAGGAAAKDRREAQLEDLQALHAGYVEKSVAFTPAARARAERLVEALQARAGQMSDAAFDVELMRLAALADNGHDGAYPGDGAWLPPQRAKVRFIWFSDALLIARAAPEYSDLLGAQVLAVEGLATRAFERRLDELGGGTPAYRRWNLTWLVENSDFLHAAGLAARPDELRLRLRLRSGRVVDRRIGFGPRAEIPRGVSADRLWSPEPYGIEAERGWRAAADPSHSPLYLQEADKLFRMADLPGMDGLYVQFRSNFDQDGQEIAPFVKAVQARIQAEHPRAIVVDQRQNTGGDIGQTRDLMRFIASQPARIYVLTGPHSFSAGIVSAAALKHDGVARVKLVGEPVGDRLRFSSEGEMLCAPNSHFCLHPTSGVWDLAHGCEGEAACYGDPFDAKVGDLHIDLPAPIRSKDWLAGRDPGLEAIRVDLARGR